MPGDGDRKLIRDYSAAVVPDPDESDTTALHVDFDPARAGVQAVLDQLFDDRGGALNDFARGDLVDELVGKDADRHRGPGSTGIGKARSVPVIRLGRPAYRGASDAAAAGAARTLATVLRRDSANRVPTGGKASKYL